jgi:hypothetical protein
MPAFALEISVISFFIIVHILALKQVQTLKTLVKKKMRAANIARTSKRTEGATRQKTIGIGLSLDSRV